MQLAIALVKPSDRDIFLNSSKMIPSFKKTKKKMACLLYVGGPTFGVSFAFVSVRIP